jgi:mono/diheme cytochrome c family protein
MSSYPLRRRKPRRWLRALAYGAVGAVLLCAGGVGLAYLRKDRVFEAPAPPFAASRDSSIIARGRYLVHGPGHCADCHAAPEAKANVEDGVREAPGGVAPGGEAPLTGGYVLRTFLGEMRASNLTSDDATGLGAVSDPLLARFFRTGIDHRGHVGLPVMQYPDLSDADLLAIVSYLRSLPPVTHAVPPSAYNVLGWITKAWFLGPFSPERPAPAGPPPLPAAEWGSYLANSVATCASCHTARNLKTGEFTGPRFAGGLVLRKADDPAQVLVSPNLTPDPRTGIIAGWSREQFVARFRRGKLRPWSPMPWGPFSRMTDLDLESIYLYLHSLGPVERENRPD